MKQKLAQIGLIVVIVVALGFVVKQLKPKPYTYERILVDVQASKVFSQKMVVGQAFEFPADSPFSEGKNAYPVYKCMKDGTVFAFEEPSFSPDAPPANPDAMMPKCPVCGSMEITMPELPEGQKSMDVPGPVTIVKPSVQ